VWATSWGVSTRLMGALIMTHSDDEGLVLPPKLAPHQVVIVPIYKGEEELKKISVKAEEIKKALIAKGIRVIYDDRDTQRPGWKFAEYELKGVPVRIAIGPRDMENGVAEIARRDTKVKESVKQGDIVSKVEHLMTEIQENLYKRTIEFRNSRMYTTDSYEEFKKILDDKGGFILAHWDGTPETEEKIKNGTKATIRCIPLDAVNEDGKCILTGKPSKQRVIFARAY
jgi:prolyl-tRNA synthetase